MNETFIRTAAALRPQIQETATAPVCCFHLTQNGGQWEASDTYAVEEAYAAVLRKGDALYFDFGEHMVGYLSFSAAVTSGTADAPVYLRVVAGERLCELGEDPDNYTGVLSRSWLQVEHLHVDILPASIALPRRYAFRYWKIEVLDTSNQFGISLRDLSVCAVSAVRMEEVKPLGSKDPFWNKMDEIALRTLRDCMQEVFEDGPKRDRRLWLGDLYLQSLANYATFGKNDLVKRCLYLFAGLARDNGAIHACCFLYPEPHTDGCFLLDYALLFTSTLYEYGKATGDRQTVEQLWPAAYRQLEIAAEWMGENGVLADSTDWWCHIDWSSGNLNKQAGAQGVFLFALRQGAELAAELRAEAEKACIDRWIAAAENGMRNVLWDAEAGFFRSGAEGQISLISQVWGVLSGVLSPEKARALLLRCRERRSEMAVQMSTPYAVHYWIEALLRCGLTEIAGEELRAYWGGMMALGADCFWETYDPERPDFSPYGTPTINSYCHAWSCTPTYFLRRYALG